MVGTNGHISHYIGCFTDITLQKRAEMLTLLQKRRLETEVESVQSELAQSNIDRADINKALDVLWKKRHDDQASAQHNLSGEAERTVLPLLKKLKGHLKDKDAIRLIGILEANFTHLLECYGAQASLPAAYQKLSPVEMQVASMVRQSHSTKAIAAALRISPGTVNLHRKHIRKKLGLARQTVNLSCYLQSLEEGGSQD